MTPLLVAAPPAPALLRANRHCDIVASSRSIGIPPQGASPPHQRFIAASPGRATPLSVKFTPFSSPAGHKEYTMKRNNDSGDAAAPFIIDINGHRFAPKGLSVDVAIEGHYMRKTGGVMLFDTSGNPFLFIAANRWHEYFFVSCSPFEGKVWYMHAVTTKDSVRLGLEDMQYSDCRALAERLVREVDASHAETARCKVASRTGDRRSVPEGTANLVQLSA
jgi:hypothetical protein